VDAGTYSAAVCRRRAGCGWRSVDCGRCHGRWGACGALGRAPMPVL